MIRLCHFVHRDGPGGGPKVIRQLLEGLPAAEFEQSLVCGGSGALSAWARSCGIPCWNVPTESVVRALFALPRVASVFRKARPDILILHGQWAGPIGTLAARWAGISRRVYVAHCPAFYHSTSLFRAIRNYIAEKIPCAGCDRVVTLSDGNFYNYLFRGWAPESALVKIPNGMDPIEELPPLETLRKELGWPTEGRHAVWAGRMDDQKRVDWLLEAWKSGAAGKDHHLWLVGSGNEERKLKEQVKAMGMEESVHFVGPKDDALRWIAAADVVVLSSLYEGHALVPLEAMAAGKPVVAFETDGVTDSVQNELTGLLVPLGDTASLGAAIGRLLSSPEIAEFMGKAGRTFVMDTFPLSRMLKSYRDLLVGVANQKPSTR